MSQVHVRVAEYENPTANVRWDEDGRSVICKIDYATQSLRHASNPDLRQLIDEQFDIRAPEYVINAGMLSMLFDSGKRIKAFDFYTNPEQWTVCSIPFVDAAPRSLHVDTVFDENGQGESMPEPAALYEPLRGTLYLSWDDVSTWYAVAPPLALGVTDDDRLAQIRLDGLHLQQDMAKQNPAGLWTRLRRRFGHSR
ncbi:hypothetical protein [Paraburkholderia sp.]|uniref:hypothetical protein n=1 Tax=Paraburkholderia sp. TaxID=1926495 RepID=UPI0039E42DB0